MGDCFAYALAKDLDQPLLFKGEDFPHTDVTPGTALTVKRSPCQGRSQGLPQEYRVLL